MPEFAFTGLSSQEIVEFKDAFDIAAFASGERNVPTGSLVAYTGENFTFGVRALVSALASKNAKNPILLYRKISGAECENLKVAAELGCLLSDGIGDALVLDSADEKAAVSLAFDILQAAESVAARRNSSAARAADARSTTSSTCSERSRTGLGISRTFR